MASPPLVAPEFVMSYDGMVSDYRSAVDASGQYLVFERARAGSSAFTLQLYELGGSAEPSPFAPKLQTSTRPDWCWLTGEVAFNNDQGIWITPRPLTPGASLLPDTAGMIYPAWCSDGSALLVMNEQSTASPRPCTSQISTAGVIITPVMANDTLWGGMPAVDPVNGARYAFAGQLIHGQSAYDQDRNYIWLVDATTDPVTIRPLDQHAPPSGPFDPAFQGRAPWWSPDGQWVAFESDRANPGGLYAIYIQDSAGAYPAMQVLDTCWNANHAKWFPSGTQLIATVEQTPGATVRGLASLDVSAFVGGART